MAGILQDLKLTVMIKGIVVLQSLKVSHLSVIPIIFYGSQKFENCMCELCTFPQIWSHMVNNVFVLLS